MALWAMGYRFNPNNCIIDFPSTEYFITMLPSSSGCLTIDLAAIQANWHQVAATLKHADCAAVVKANAYGVGDCEVAGALYKAGCRAFFLATLEEAAKLRLMLPDDSKLFVLGGARQGAENEFWKSNLIPVLFTLEDIDRWEAFCLSRRELLPCAIKLDTGMSRFGLSGSDINKLIASIPQRAWLNPILLMSHLACADEPHHPLNQRQLERFRVAAASIKMFFPSVKLSLANSSGVFLGDEYHFDMVRVGAALYGINPQPSALNSLRNVLGLKLPVLQIRITEASVRVGYGADGQAEAATRLAVVAGGYADGLHRTLGPRPKGKIEGVTVFVVGRISMDSMVFDISALADNPQYIEVINNELTLDYLMTENRLLGYELLTGLGARFQRQYVGLEC